MSTRTCKYKIGKITDARAHEILRKPLITEKSTMASENGQVVFQVAMDASKPEIAQAVERIFNVKVSAVNTLISKGKMKRFRGRKGFRSGTKKALVTLVDGQGFDVMSAAA